MPASTDNIASPYAQHSGHTNTQSEAAPAVTKPQLASPSAAHALPTDDPATAAASRIAGYGSSQELPHRSDAPTDANYIDQGPGHEADVRGLNGSGLASRMDAPTGRADHVLNAPSHGNGTTAGAASADPVSSNGHSGHAPELGTLSSVVTPPALAPNAPGKSNAYDAEEEREVDMAPLAPVQAADPSTSPSVTPAKRPAESGRRELPDDMTREIGARAGDLSTASPVDASGTAPSASAVASTNELVLSPVKVEGQSVRDTRKFGGDLQSATAGDQEAQTQVDQVVSAIDEPAAAGAPKVENQTMPLSERESMTQDAQTADARPAGLTATSAAPSVAPAVAAMGGVSGPSALPGSMPHVGASPIASGSGTEEPPAKRARKASQKFAGYETPKPASSSSSSSPHAHRPIVMTQAQLKFAQSSVKSLRSRPESPAFLAPVDPIALGVPMYHQIITHPMDLGTIDLKLALTGMAMKSGKPTDKAKQAQKTGLDPTKDVYPDIPAFEADVRLVFANCARFNGPDSPYTHNALTLEKVFDKQMKSVPAAPAEPVAALAQSPAEGKKEARRPSNPIPTIRRSSSDGGRPKREIHPPPPKDLPYADEPSAGTSSAKKSKGSKKGKKGAVLTPREQAYHAKVAQEELRFCDKLVSELFKPAHYDVAWVFYDLVDRTLDFAPAYYSMIKKPIALRQIQEKVRTGQYPDASAFEADMRLLFNNCFKFNPPDTDVHVMGQKLKKVFEEKMSKKPVPKPLTPEPEEEEEEEEEDGGDPSSDVAAQIRQQIEMLSANLAVLEGSKTKNHKLIKDTKANLDRVMQSTAPPKAPKKSSGARKSSTAGADAGPPAAAAGKSKKAKASDGAGAGSSKKAVKNGKSSKKAAYGSDEDTPRAVTYEQKEELAAKITELDGDRLDQAIRIIHEDRPELKNNDEEIELDIDALNPRTLYKLYKFVVRPPKPRNKPVAPTGKNAPIDGRKRGTGGLKRKNLDESEEAERIARLQQQLQQFDQPGKTAPPPTDALAAGVGLHDDLVLSESSSGEEDSGSDSDSDSD